MKIASIIAFSLVIVGALVWGLIGFFNFNLVAAIFGAGSVAMISRTIYAVVGLSALWLLIVWAVYRPFRAID